MGAFRISDIKIDTRATATRPLKYPRRAPRVKRKKFLAPRPRPSPPYLSVSFASSRCRRRRSHLSTLSRFLSRFSPLPLPRLPCSSPPVRFCPRCPCLFLLLAELRSDLAARLAREVNLALLNKLIRALSELLIRVIARVVIRKRDADIYVGQNATIRAEYPFLANYRYPARTPTFTARLEGKNDVIVRC